ncbi:hypothetical protein K1719_026798 [Acacia pycnantha]|nr:hypothetical protein K1719_026798 [Acacia pycnantha]
MELSLVTPEQVPLSTEENDLIRRSSKKIKSGEGSKYIEEWPKLGMVGTKYQLTWQTFAEKLQGIIRDEKMVEDPVELGLSDDSLSDSDDNLAGRRNRTKKSSTVISGDRRKDHALAFLPR